MKSGVELITAERERQISEEGWTAEHDASHSDGELGMAAICYVLGRGNATIEGTYVWPWENRWWKPSRDPVRNLVKAGALIAAEIDRLTLLRGERP